MFIYRSNGKLFRPYITVDICVNGHGTWSGKEREREGEGLVLPLSLTFVVQSMLLKL